MNFQPKKKTLTAACWYLGDGETPGAIAHSHRPSLCFASPYALASGYKNQLKDEIKRQIIKLNQEGKKKIIKNHIPEK